MTSQLAHVSQTVTDPCQGLAERIVVKQSERRPAWRQPFGTVE